jgi:D-glycero-alpha-D-manno-heptose-7-phosphate kinase
VIAARAPLRISLGGGGTDLPSYYREHGGFVVSTAIDQYVAVLAAGGFRDRYLVKHLECEEVDEPSEIAHPILREAISRHWEGPPLELASVGDVPPGTGLGSSGAYAVCVVKTLRLAAGLDASREELAEAACELEIDLLGRSVGKQDQYAAAHGGLCAYTFDRDDTVDVRRLRVGGETLRSLRDEFLLFYTGEARSAASMLSHQVDRTLAGDEEMAATLHRSKELALETCSALEAGDLERFAELMDAHWEAKRARAPGAVTEAIERLRSLAKRSGGRGVMLMGAGGGGFLLVYTRSPDETRRAMARAGLVELRFGLDATGCEGAGRPLRTPSGEA